MNSYYALLAALILAGAAGCSKQSQQEYSQAGQSLKHAAAETGKALKQDTSVAAQAAKNATQAAKTTVETKKAGNEKGTTVTTTDNNGHVTKTVQHH